MLRSILVTTVIALGVEAAVVCAQPQPKDFFQNKIKLADSDIQKIDQGQVVTKVLDSGDTKYGILLFGAVYVNAPVARFHTAIRDIKRLTENKVYLAVQEFSPNGALPHLSDFDRLTLDKQDIDELQTCKPGDCDIQIINIAQFQKQVELEYAGQIRSGEQALQTAALPCDERLPEGRSEVARQL